MAPIGLRLGAGGAPPGVLAVPVTGAGFAGGEVAGTAVRLPAGLAATLAAYREDVSRADGENTGAAGTVHTLPLPGGRPRRVLLVCVGDGAEADWRAAGAAVVRAASKESAVTLALPPDAGEDAVSGAAEGVLLGSYRYTRAAGDDGAPALRRVTLAVAEPDRYAAALAAARVRAEATCLARDLTNTHSSRKSPRWLAAEITRAATAAGVQARVRDADALRAEGFGGILAVGGGSPRPPRLVELRYRPRGAARHVVLVGKGITYDTGGIQIKSASGMQLMRKDMGGAAAVAAATVGAARLRLPVRITTLLPLADNCVGADAYRPGDVVTHYGGLTSEIRNTDAEGRVVLGDALAYAVRRLAPDVVVDLATLTGAQSVALGKQTAALYGAEPVTAALTAAAADAGEKVWRMPLPEDYVELLRTDIADVTNAPAPGRAGSVTAALYLREFVGAHRDRWAHLDMSGPAWSSAVDGVNGKGATGWGVRTLLRYLATT